MVIAINMMDIVRKKGDKINIEELSRELGCKIIEISALNGDGVMDAAEAAIDAAKLGQDRSDAHFLRPVEHAPLLTSRKRLCTPMSEDQQRWYAIKIFERDDKALAQLKIDFRLWSISRAISRQPRLSWMMTMPSIITNERYVYIAQLIKNCYKKKKRGRCSPPPIR